MTIGILPLTGEDEASLVAEAACRAPTFSLLARLLGRAACRDGAPLGAAALMLTAGEAQALALKLRQASMDGPMQARLTCSACGEALDIDLAPLSLLADSAVVPAAIAVGGNSGEAVSVTCRAPLVADLLAVAEIGDPLEAAAVLLARCAIASDGAGAPVVLADLPDAARDAIAAHLLALDPQAETLLACTCPACGAAVDAALDPAHWLVTELAGQANTLFAQVLAIAARTGWTEQAILAMPRRRRQGYAAALGAA